MFVTFNYSNSLFFLSINIVEKIIAFYYFAEDIMIFVDIQTVLKLHLELFCLFVTVSARFNTCKIQFERRWHESSTKVPFVLWFYDLPSPFECILSYARKLKTNAFMALLTAGRRSQCTFKNGYESTNNRLSYSILASFSVHKSITRNPSKVCRFR